MIPFDKINFLDIIRPMPNTIRYRKYILGTSIPKTSKIFTIKHLYREYIKTCQEKGELPLLTWLEYKDFIMKFLDKFSDNIIAGKKYRMPFTKSKYLAIKKFKVRMGYSQTYFFNALKEKHKFPLLNMHTDGWICGLRCTDEYKNRWGFYTIKAIEQFKIKLKNTLYTDAKAHLNYDVDRETKNGNN